MDLCVQETVSQASRKLTTILRTGRFHDVTRLVHVYKSKILPFVEYRTPAVYHAARTILGGIDAIQKRFLRECNLTEEDALLLFNLAPLGNTGFCALCQLNSVFAAKGERVWVEPPTWGRASNIGWECPSWNGLPSEKVAEMERRFVPSRHFCHALCSFFSTKCERCPMRCESVEGSTRTILVTPYF